MHANQVKQALALSESPDQLQDQAGADLVIAGRSIQGPNTQGVWELVCNVPMRIQPNLVVQFAYCRYSAEMFDMTPLVKRLETVRVRFKVYDQQSTRRVKHAVEILSVFLDAEL